MTNTSRPKDGTIVQDIVTDWLKDNGYDGLVNADYECGCTPDKFAFCECVDRSCTCAYRVDHPDDPGGFMLAVSRDKFNSSVCMPSDKLEPVVAHPSHYCSGPIESIDAIHSALGDLGFLDFCLGLIGKYYYRCGKKPDNTVEMDVRKIKQYCDFILEKLPDSILKSTRESR